MAGIEPLVYRFQGVIDYTGVNDAREQLSIFSLGQYNDHVPHFSSAK